MVRKGLTISAALLVMLTMFVSPFRITYAEGQSADDAGFIAAVEFFRTYGLAPVNSMAYNLKCTSYSNNACAIYEMNEDGNTATAMYNAMKPITTFNSPSAYTTSNRFRTTKEPLYIVFLSNTNFTSANISIYPQSGYTVTATRLTNNTQTVMTPNGYYLITLVITATTTNTDGTTWASLGLPGTSTTTIIPFYKGPKISMPDELHRVVFGTGQTYDISDDETHSILNSIKSLTTTNAVNVQQILSKVEDIRWNFVNGNQEANSTSTSLNNKTTELTTSITNYNQLESDFVSDMNDSIDDIDFNSSLISNGNLLNSITWVKQQYDRMTVNTVFGSMIQYALLFGLGILIIGRFK